MPGPTREFIDMIAEMLDPLGDIRSKRMFGGVCFFCDGLAFALIADDVLYVKVDDASRPAHESAGHAPFRPFPDKPLVMQYYPVPESALEDPDEMLDWTRPALAAARRAAAEKPKTGGRKKTRKAAAV